MNGAWIPDLLSAPESLVEAVEATPSRDEVQHWLNAWPGLDAHFGSGHAERLERALLDAAISQPSVAFRATWVLALIVQSGNSVADDLATGLMQLVDRSQTEGIRREATRALMGMPLPVKLMASLTDWAVNVVYLQGNPPARMGQALSIIERNMGGFDAETIGVNPTEMKEALEHVMAHSESEYLKKKAARLMVRLSSP